MFLLVGDGGSSKSTNLVKTERCYDKLNFNLESLNPGLIWLQVRTNGPGTVTNIKSCTDIYIKKILL